MCRVLLEVRMPARPIPLAAGLAAGLSAAILWLALLSAPPPALAGPAGTTFTVNSAADVPDAAPGDGHCETATGNHFCTLRAAIQDANLWPGADTIQLQASTTYLLSHSGAADDNSLRGDLDITASVSLLGAGPDSTIIDAGALTPTERVFEIWAGTVVISGVSVQHGHSSYNASGLFIRGGQVSLLSSHVTSNTSSGLGEQGIGITNFGALTVTNSLISDNVGNGAGSQGGGILNAGPLRVISSTIRNNQIHGGLRPAASSDGGGLHFFRSSPPTSHVS